MTNKTQAHPGLGELTDTLDDLWIEVGKRRWCPNNCKYCFSEIREDAPLSKEQVLNVLEQFKQGGGKTLAIPGAGEPFHPRNIETTLEILDFCQDSGILATVFTEGSLIDENLADSLKQYTNSRFLIKCNSKNPEIQDDLVQRQGYSKLRDNALQILIDKGFANPDDSKSRVGIVTSIMTENLSELPNLLRYARTNGLIFDCDTIIDRGEGKGCGLKPSDPQTKEAILELQKIDHDEFGKDWKITSTYVGSPPCTRFNRHLYVRQNGFVHPCVGSPGVILGNVSKQSLQEIWNSPVMKIVRSHKYIGPCTSCKNFQEHECYSCLGRRAPNLTAEKILELGAVPIETNCFNYRI